MTLSIASGVFSIAVLRHHGEVSVFQADRAEIDCRWLEIPSYRRQARFTLLPVSSHAEAMLADEMRMKRLGARLLGYDRGQ